MPVKPGWDIVFIARPAVAGTDFVSLEEAVGVLLSRAELLIRKYEEICPGVD
jgi:RNase P protein component